MQAKKWWKSKTLWFNIVSGVLLALESNMQLIQQAVGENAYLVMLLVNIVGNAVLRALTKESLCA